MIPSDCVLTWAKRIEAQQVQMVIINSLHEVQNFDCNTTKR